MDNKHLARIAIVTLLAIGCFLILQPFIAAVLFAIIICVTTWPLYAWLLGRLGGRPALTSSVMTLLLMLVVLVPMVFLAISLADAVPPLVAKLRAVFEQMAVAPPEWLRRIPLVGEQLDAYWHSLAESREEFNKLLKQLYDPARTVLTKTVALTGEGLLQIVLVLFISFFIYRDGAALAERLRSGSVRLGGELGGQMLTLSRNTVMGVMVGIVGTAAAQSLVTLIGLITKHGILIVEFSNQLRQQGRQIREAVMEAASLRLRPILMTTGAMVLGALPLALSTGAGAESRQQIGWVIVGGMSVGTMLTIFVVPTVYAWLARSRIPGEITEQALEDAVPAK